MSRPSDDQLRTLGASLREIDPSTLARDDDGSKVRWFLGENATELFTWSHGEREDPHHLQLVFARVSIEWSDKKGLTTGTFKGGSSALGGRYDPYLLSIGKQIDRDVCKAALVLLDASPLKGRLTAPLVSAIEAALAREPASAP